ncbi:MAG: hypothetical protein Q8S73_00565 [Deltaproteobacteria bacterium]|nr:hypothetical protein [Myxococcales bacterium]MDP3212565.1 hypothetical protein [Deltaproteobacteria bacterium]
MATLLGFALALPMFGLFVLGMVNFKRISRAAGVPYVGPSSAMQIYRYGFTVMRTSPETRNMLIGFVGVFLWPLAAGALMVLARGPLR